MSFIFIFILSVIKYFSVFAEQLEKKSVEFNSIKLERV